MRLSRPSFKFHAILAIVLLGACIWIVPRAFAKLAANTIDTIATISDDGQTIIVTGPILNTQVEWNDIRVTVTQRTTGAVAEGRVRLLGATITQHWVVEADVKGQQDFEPGEATAVAFATSSLHGQVTDAHQWLVHITLVDQ